MRPLLKIIKYYTSNSTKVFFITQINIPLTSVILLSIRENLNNKLTMIC